MNRRRFLRDSALASASVALMGAVRFAAHAESALTDSRIEVLLDEPLGTISANIYGTPAPNGTEYALETSLVLRESTTLAPGLATRATQNGTA